MKLTATRDLTALREAAKRAIDRGAERIRTLPHLLTPGAGQAQEYLETAREARLIADDPDPDPADYPWLEAERQALEAVGVTATLVQIGASIRQNELAVWAGQVGPAIKKIRRTYKMMVDAAETPAEIESLRETAFAELQAIGGAS